MGAPRSGRNSAWSVQQKKTKPTSLSEWLHTNGYAKDLVNQVFAGSCPAPALAKLKRARRDARGPEGNLSRSQRTAIHGSGDAAPAGTHGGRKVDSKSDAKLRDMERKLKAAEARASAAEQRAKATSTPPAAAADAGDAGAATSWACSCCGAAHRKHCAGCRICGTQRVIDADEDPDEQMTNGRTPEVIQADIVRMQSLRASTKSEGLDTEAIDKRLKALQMELTGPPKRLPHNQYEKCRKICNRTSTFLTQLIDKRSHIEGRLMELHADLDSVDRGLEKAQAAHEAAEKALNDAAAALQPEHASAEEPALAPATEAAKVNVVALRDVMADLETIQHKLQTGGCAALIPEARQEFEDYLSGRNGDAGPLDFELWQQRRVAQLLQEEVLQRCQPLLSVPAAGSAVAASSTSRPGAPARSASRVSAGDGSERLPTRAAVTSKPDAATESRGATAQAMRAAQKEAAKDAARAAT